MSYTRLIVRVLWQYFDNRSLVSNRFEKGFSIGGLPPLREQEPEFDYKVTKFP